MESFDVLIVGAGPAGSSCAWGLRQSGLNVVVLDKQAFPRDKVCGGWIKPNVLTALEIDPGEYTRGRMLQPITGFRVGRIGGPAVETGYGIPVSYGIRRREFDEYLVRRSSARLYLGVALISLKRSENGWIANEQIEARLVVGAGGHFCPVASLAGVKRPGETPVVAQETEFEMNAQQLSRCCVRGEIPELYFCSDMKGYGWCIRKGGFLNVGLGRADTHHLSAHVTEFLGYLKRSERVAFDLPPLRGHAYLLRGASSRTTVGDGILLIGDAAGLAYPQSGEGIGPAVESGLVAAKTILAGHGQYARAQLEVYQRMMTAWQQPWTMKGGRLVPSRLVSYVARVLLRQPWFVRDVVLNGWFLRASPRPS